MSNDDIDELTAVSPSKATALTAGSISTCLDGAGEYIKLRDTEVFSYQHNDIGANFSHNGEGDGVKFFPNEEEEPICYDNLPLCPNNEWLLFGIRLAASATLHPFEYAKVLIQLGHEPLPAHHGKTLFGKPVQVLPNVFKYVGHIRSMDGLYGCYRGLAPKLIGSVVSLIGSEKIAEQLGLISNKEEIIDPESYESFVLNLKRDVVLTASGLVLSHPFHVISIRMMAQFVGHENIYNTILESIAEIYHNDGISGFFAGLIPKLVCDMSCVVLTSSIVYLINKCYLKDKLIRQYNAGFTQYVISSILYPLQVVSTCMAVTSSRLAAGRPPLMPEYRNWISCWSDLEARGELKRGGSIFWRTIALHPKRPITQHKMLPVLSK